MNEQTERGRGNRMQEVCVMMNVCPVLCGIVGRFCATEQPAPALPATLCNEALSLSLHEGETYSGTLPFLLCKCHKEILGWRSLMENMNGLAQLSHFWLSTDYIWHCDSINSVKMGSLKKRKKRKAC